MTLSSSAVSTLYQSERARLLRFAKRLTRNTATSEDLVQDAFLRLLSRRGSGPITAEEAFVTRILRNLALNHLRHARMGVEIAVEESVLAALADKGPGIEDRIIARQSLEQVLRAILSLPPRRREIFVLHRFEDLTYDQIAARLEISRNTVMVQIVNALADLRRQL
ncbi:sigma-70 family RNA polymerase sigma factor [Oceanicola sp. S124]|uniref:sigma-70 family RNA polymerase sigma factor n=1 Tax=Oceanicola sp. S124 TaxID=1042378 RepID=UPI0002559432|nr:sigma-70 family RNA polymerase sigma factor [Oceanicola sp. S124]